MLQPDTDVILVFAGQVALDELAMEVGGPLAIEVGGLALAKRRAGSPATSRRHRCSSRSLQLTSGGSMFGKR